MAGGGSCKTRGEHARQRHDSSNRRRLRRVVPLAERRTGDERFAPSLLSIPAVWKEKGKMSKTVWRSLNSLAGYRQLTEARVPFNSQRWEN